MAQATIVVRRIPVAAGLHDKGLARIPKHVDGCVDSALQPQLVGGAIGDGDSLFLRAQRGSPEP
jgi:hypothetical protein